MKTLFQLAQFNSANYMIIEAMMPKKQSSPMKKLFNLVFSDKILNDKQARQFIYGSSNLSTFSRLKSRLKDLLIKATLLQNSNTEPEHSRVNEAINQFRYTLVSKLLVQEKLNQLSIDIAERTLVKSIKYSSTENILILTRILVRHYGVSEHNNNKLNKYITIQEKYNYIYLWEVKAENYYIDLQRTQLYSLASPNTFTIEKAKKYTNELEKVKNVHTSFFYINRYKVKATYYEYIKDYKAILTLSDKVLKELSDPLFKTNNILDIINIRKAWSLIQAGRNREAIIITNMQMKRLLSGSLIWYYFAHYRLKALLYKGDYHNAAGLIKLMIQSHDFAKVAGNHRELFYTTLGYIHLIVDSGLAGDPKKYKKILPEFKIGKFLNTTPVFSKDKRGINVSILLMHVAILLQRKNYNAIIDRIDSLNQYAYRYLRKDDTFRSNCMIKMVIQMTKADFHPIRTERYTKDLLLQLEHVKLAGSGENIETEIIPYEVLWKIMMKAL